MAVPELVTTNVGMFSWYRQSGCTQVTLADCFGILHSYDQYAEYVDGTIKIFDSGAESAAPDNYNLVNVRIRTDGFILAWLARELTPLANQTIESATTTVITMSSTKCQIQNYHDSSARNILGNELAGNVLEMTSGTMNGNKYTIQSNTDTTITLHTIYGDNVSTDVSGEAGETFRIYSSRGNLVWWGHTSTATEDPTNQSTRLGRAIYEIWEQLKTNQVGGSGDSLVYTDVNYYDYEYTSATSLYILGYSRTVAGHSATDDHYYYCTIPSGRTKYDMVLNYGYNQYIVGGTSYVRFVWNSVDIFYEINTTGTWESNGFRNVELSQTLGVQNTLRQYALNGLNASNTTYTNSAIIIVTDG